MRALVLIVLTCALVEGQPGTKHARIEQKKLDGKHVKLSLGTLFLSDKLPKAGSVPLLVHFHGPGWIAETAGARSGKIAVLSISLGSGSAKYAAPFKDSKRFGQLIAEAETKAGLKFEAIALSGWSAGYGAVRAILRVDEYYRKVRWVILLDGMHTGYLKDRTVSPADIDSFVKFAKDAVADRKQFRITHTKIVPGSYASTTETADYLLAQVGVKRQPFVGAGPFGLPQETEAGKGGLRLFGCAGTTAADHVDHIHALPALVALMNWEWKGAR